MKNLFAVTIIGWLVCLSGCTTSQPIDLDNMSLIPAPVNFQGMSGSPFVLDAKTTISCSDASLLGIAEQLSANINKQTGVLLTVDPVPFKKKPKTIYLEVKNSLPEFSSLAYPIGVSPKDADPTEEFYMLDISAKEIHICGTAPEGIHRGVTSLCQLINGGEAAGPTVSIPQLKMTDAPKYAWRGLSLDVSRYFLTVEEVKETIDKLALYKMNVLHIHLTDNQGWRIEIKKYPKLTEIGAQVPNKNRKGGYYSQEEYKDIVQYAADRFITVVPEIDLPGHTAAVFASYPKLKNAVNPVKTKFSIPGQQIGALDPDDKKAILFVEDVLTELAALTPGSYIHIGGDEAFGMPKAKYVSFINETRRIVSRLGKKMVGWQEAARAETGGSDLIQYWIHMQNNLFEENNDSPGKVPAEIKKMIIEMFADASLDLERAVNKNLRIILSPAAFVYLDHQYKEPSADASQQADADRLGLSFYPKVTVEEFMQWNPLEIDPLVGAEHIAGIEAAIWCETVDSFSDLQFLLLPRLAGVAEKAWASNGTTDWNEYRIRLGAQSTKWNQQKWNYFQSSLVDWE